MLQDDKILDDTPSYGGAYIGSEISRWGIHRAVWKCVATMIPIVHKILVAAIVLILSILMILLDRILGLDLFNVHGGLALGMGLVYLLPLITIFLIFAVPIAIWKLKSVSASNAASQWMITLAAPILLAFNLLLVFVSFSR
jgi:hypothetical protein